MVEMDKREALLLGIMLGDGSIGIYNKYQNKVTVTCHSEDDKDFLFNLVKPLLEELFKKNVHVNVRKDCLGTDLYIYSKEVLTYINKNWNYPIGKKKEISINKSFIRDSQIMKNIIAGFFAADGSMVITDNNGTFYPRIEFQNKSFTILNQIQNFLLDIKMKGNIYITRKHTTGNVYRLQYNGKENSFKFAKEVGFINPKHQRNFEGFVTEFIGTPM